MNEDKNWYFASEVNIINFLHKHVHMFAFMFLPYTPEMLGLINLDRI